jgi:hypothetical protein
LKQEKDNLVLTTYLFFALIIGGLIGSVATYIVQDEIQSGINSQYEEELALNELEITITQSAYSECAKRYKEPRSITCE